MTLMQRRRALMAQKHETIATLKEGIYQPNIYWKTTVDSTGVAVLQVLEKTTYSTQQICTPEFTKSIELKTGDELTLKIKSSSGATGLFMGTDNFWHIMLNDANGQKIVLNKRLYYNDTKTYTLTSDVTATKFYIRAVNSYNTGTYKDYYFELYVNGNLVLGRAS